MNYDEMDRDRPRFSANRNCYKLTRVSWALAQISCSRRLASLNCSLGNLKSLRQLTSGYNRLFYIQILLFHWGLKIYCPTGLHMLWHLKYWVMIILWHVLRHVLRQCLWIGLLVPKKILRQTCYHWGLRTTDIIRCHLKAYTTALLSINLEGHD